MSAKKGRCFSFLPGKSANPDSSNTNPSSSNNAAPSSSQRTGTSLALPIIPQGNAHPAQGEISEVGSPLTSDSPSLAHAGRDKVSEIGSTSTPSAPSPPKLPAHAKRLRETAEQINKRIREVTEGLKEESDVARAKRLRETAEQHNKRIREVTEGLKEESDFAHLEAFLDQLSDFIKKEKQDKEEKKIKEKEKKEEKKKKTEEKKKGEEKENNPSEPKRPIISSFGPQNLLKLKDVLYEAVSAAKDFTSSGDAKKMARGLIRDIGGGHMFNILFIVVADVWQRYEDMCDDEKKCLSLLEEINDFAKHVIYLKKVLQNELASGLASTKMLEDVVKKNIELIIETCIACCNHIEASGKRRFARRTEYGAELAKYVKKLKKAYPRSMFPISISTFEEVRQLRLHLPECSKDAVETKKKVQLRKPDYPECSKDADIVGETELKRLEQRALVTQDVKRFSLTTATEIEEFSDIKDEPKGFEKLGHLCYNPELDKENVDGDLSDLINYIPNTVTTVETKKPVQLRKPDYPEYPKDAVETKKPEQLRKPDYPECSKDAVGTKKPVQLRKPDYPEYPKDAGKSYSTPSSSRLRKESEYAEDIKEAAKELDTENVDADLSDLINYISRLLDFIEEKEKEKKKKKGKTPSKQEATRNYWPGSTFFTKLKDVLGETIEGIQDVPTSDANKIARDLVKHVGKAHLVTTCFLVVANILERYEAISTNIFTNKGACLSLLKEMVKLARYVNDLQKRPELKESMVDSIKEAIGLIVEASLACCTQINAANFAKFFGTTVNGKKLAEFKTRLAETDTHMQRNFNLYYLYDAPVRRQRPMELQYPEHLKRRSWNLKTIGKSH